jgi:hypothetical protein
MEFKPGDDLSWAGVATLEGVTDWTGYTATAQIRRKEEDGSPSRALFATASFAWADVMTGAFVLTVPRSVTGTWPADTALLIDMKFTTPTGKVVTTGTAEFTTTKRVTT